MITVRFKDFVFECESPAEAAEIARRMHPEPQAEGAPERPPSPVATPAPIRKKVGRRIRGNPRALKLLETVRGEPQRRVRPLKLANAVGIEDPKGLGPVFMSLRRTLREIGIDYESVLKPGRNGSGKLWIGGPALDDAIIALGGPTLDLLGMAVEQKGGAG